MRSSTSKKIISLLMILIFLFANISFAYAQSCMTRQAAMEQIVASLTSDPQLKAQVLAQFDANDNGVLGPTEISALQELVLQRVDAARLRQNFGSVVQTSSIAQAVVSEQTDPQTRAEVDAYRDGEVDLETVPKAAATDAEGLNTLRELILYYAGYQEPAFTDSIARQAYENLQKGADLTEGMDQFQDMLPAGEASAYLRQLELKKNMIQKRLQIPSVKDIDPSLTYVSTLGVDLMGAVHLVKKDGKQYALKIGQGSLKQEYDTFVRLQDTGITPRVYQYFDAQNAYLKDYVEGALVSDFSENYQGTLPFEKFKDIAAAYAKIRSAGVDIGGIKGQNIVIEADGTVRIIDFTLGKPNPKFRSQMDSMMMVNMQDYYATEDNDALLDELEVIYESPAEEVQAPASTGFKGRLSTAVGVAAASLLFLPGAWASDSLGNVQSAPTSILSSPILWYGLGITAAVGTTYYAIKVYNWIRGKTPEVPSVHTLPELREEPATAPLLDYTRSLTGLNAPMQSAISIAYDMVKGTADVEENIDSLTQDLQSAGLTQPQINNFLDILLAQMPLGPNLVDLEQHLGMFGMSLFAFSRSANYEDIPGGLTLDQERFDLSYDKMPLEFQNLYPKDSAVIRGIIESKGAMILLDTSYLKSDFTGDAYLANFRHIADHERLHRRFFADNIDRTSLQSLLTNDALSDLKEIAKTRLDDSQIESQFFIEEVLAQYIGLGKYADALEVGQNTRDFLDRMNVFRSDPHAAEFWKKVEELGIFDEIGFDPINTKYQTEEAGRTFSLGSKIDAGKKGIEIPGQVIIHESGDFAVKDGDYVKYYAKDGTEITNHDSVPQGLQDRVGPEFFPGVGGSPIIMKALAAEVEAPETADLAGYAIIENHIGTGTFPSAQAVREGITAEPDGTVHISSEVSRVSADAIGADEEFYLSVVESRTPEDDRCKRTGSGSCSSVSGGSVKEGSVEDAVLDINQRMEGVDPELSVFMSPEQLGMPAQVPSRMIEISAVSDVVEKQDFEDVVDELYALAQDEYRIGKGGMGSVYSFHKVPLEIREPIEQKLGFSLDDVLMKVESRRSIKISGVEQMVDTGDVIAVREGVRHESISDILAVSEMVAPLGSDYVILMERIPGMTLQSAAASGAFEPGVLAAAVYRDIGSALRYLGSKGLAYNDIKPANIMMYRDADNNIRAKLIDLGLLMKVEDYPTSLGGTPTYYSPQQARKEGMDYRSDMFSLGLVLYELTAGKKIFQEYAKETGNQDLIKDSYSIADLQNIVSMTKGFDFETLDSIISRDISDPDLRGKILELFGKGSFVPESGLRRLKIDKFFLQASESALMSEDDVVRIHDIFRSGDNVKQRVTQMLDRNFIPAAAFSFYELAYAASEISSPAFEQTRERALQVTYLQMQITNLKNDLLSAEDPAEILSMIEAARVDIDNTIAAIRSADSKVRIDGVVYNADTIRANNKKQADALMKHVPDILSSSERALIHRFAEYHPATVAHMLAGLTYLDVLARQRYGDQAEQILPTLRKAMLLHDVGKMEWSYHLLDTVFPVGATAVSNEVGAPPSFFEEDQPIHPLLTEKVLLQDLASSVINMPASIRERMSALSARRVFELGMYDSAEIDSLMRDVDGIYEDISRLGQGYEDLKQEIDMIRLAGSHHESPSDPNAGYPRHRVPEGIDPDHIQLMSLADTLAAITDDNRMYYTSPGSAANAIAIVIENGKNHRTDEFIASLFGPVHKAKFDDLMATHRNNPEAHAAFVDYIRGLGSDERFSGIIGSRQENFREFAPLWSSIFTNKMSWLVEDMQETAEIMKGLREGIDIAAMSSLNYRYHQDLISVLQLYKQSASKLSQESSPGVTFFDEFVDIGRQEQDPAILKQYYDFIEFQRRSKDITGEQRSYLDFLTDEIQNRIGRQDSLPFISVMPDILSSENLRGSHLAQRILGEQAG